MTTNSDPFNPYDLEAIARSPLHQESRNKMTDTHFEQTLRRVTKDQQRADICKALAEALRPFAEAVSVGPLVSDDFEGSAVVFTAGEYRRADAALKRYEEAK